MPSVLRALENPSNRLPSGLVCTEWGECEKHGRYPRFAVDDSQPGYLRPQLLHSECPQCIKEREHLERFARLAIPKRFRNCTVNNFNAVSDEQKKVKNYLIDFCRNIKARIENGDSLIFSGGFGNGKTHLSCAIAKCAMQAGFSCQFTTASQILTEVKQTWDRNSKESELAVIKRYSEIDLLIVDEVGSQFGTEAEIKILFEVINNRYGDMKSTILISNAPLQKPNPNSTVKTVEDYIGRRALNRFREAGSAALTFSWPSYRGQNADSLF